MKKFFNICVLSVLGMLLLNGEILDRRFEVKTKGDGFEIEYIDLKDLKPIKAKKNKDIAITKAFALGKGKLKGEMRYTLFKDCSTDMELMREQLAIHAVVCISNITGKNISFESLKPFDDNSVKSEFNGDMGFTFYCFDPKSDYANGYKCMMVEFFCKKGQGVVMRAWLYNDLMFSGYNAEDNTFTLESPFAKNYHSFKFKDN